MCSGGYPYGSREDCQATLAQIARECRLYSFNPFGPLAEEGYRDLPEIVLGPDDETPDMLQSGRCSRITKIRLIDTEGRTNEVGVLFLIKTARPEVFDSLFVREGDRGSESFISLRTLKEAAITHHRQTHQAEEGEETCPHCPFEENRVTDLFLRHLVRGEDVGIQLIEGRRG